MANILTAPYYHYGGYTVDHSSAQHVTCLSYEEFLLGWRLPGLFVTTTTNMPEACEIWYNHTWYTSKGDLYAYNTSEQTNNYYTFS